MVRATAKELLHAVLMALPAVHVAVFAALASRSGALDRAPSMRLEVVPMLAVRGRASNSALWGTKRPRNRVSHKVFTQLLTSRPPGNQLQQAKEHHEPPQSIVCSSHCGHCSTALHSVLVLGFAIV